MVVEAMSELTAAFSQARGQAKVNDDQLAIMRERLRNFYASGFAKKYKAETGQDPQLEQLVDPLDDDAVYLQYEYIAANSHPLGQKDRLLAADDQTEYSKLHAKYHPVISKYRETFGYYDIFLVDDKTGDIIYSVFKESDFASSLKDGPYSGTNLASAFTQAMSAAWSDYVAFADYEPYRPSYEHAASFIASPIFRDGKRIGVAIFQMPIDRIDEIMKNDSTLGDETEIYAVGSDSLLRNNIGGDHPAVILKSSASTEGSRNVFTSQEKREGVGEFDGRLGDAALLSWGPVTVHQPSGAGDPQVTWALIAERPWVEVQAPTRRIFWFTAAVTAVSAVLVVALSLAISRRFTSQSRRQQELVRSHRRKHRHAGVGQ